jgi:heparin binding hemagglutinin HbhA
MPTQASTTKIPTPLYAAAGAGDLAYQQLRKLPETVASLRGRVADLRPAVTDAVSGARSQVDIDKLRELAKRNAAAFVTGAQVAQERAVAVYGELVSRGEQVIRSTRGAEATVALVPAAGSVTAEITTTEAPVSAVEQPVPAAKVAKTAVKRAPRKDA